MIQDTIHWHIEPAWRDRLPLPPDELVRAGPTETIKHGPFRSVYRLRTAALDLHVKHCRPVGIRAWLREWVRPAKALLEFRKIAAVAARQIPTLEPVAWGRATGIGPSDSFLITCRLANTTPLGQYLTVDLPALPEPQRSLRRRRLAVMLGEFLARLHAAGVRHPDLHPGNLLLGWAGDDPRLTIIDLHDATIRPALSERDRLTNLIPFNRWFIIRASRTDRLRFWRAYCSKIGQSLDAGEFVEARTRASNLRFWRGRDRRCLGTNRHFRRVDSPGLSGHAVGDFLPGELGALLRDPDALFRAPQYPLMKDSRSATVAEFDWTIGGTSRRVVLKRFRVTTRWDGPASLVRRTSALRSWSNGHAFLDGLLPTPRPLAVWHRRRGGMSWEGYLLTEKVEDATDLRKFVLEIERLPPALRRPLLHSLLDGLARLLRRMHAQGWSHRDLKASNILASRDGQVTLIDLVAPQRSRRLSRSRLARDLARLNASFLASPSISRTDRLRFLHMYGNHALTGDGDWKQWWRLIARATEQKRQRNLRNGRPLG